MKEDDTLAILKYTITQGWPHSNKEVPTEIPSYWTFLQRVNDRGWFDPEGDKNSHTQQEARGYT